MRNLKIEIQYNGNCVGGWQRHPGILGIQGSIEEAIYEITRENVTIIASGRTDSGVHALGQVANFITNSSIPASRIPMALNAKLCEDISIIHCEEVELDFHSRYHAKGKRYRYLIYNNPYRNPSYKDISYHVKYDLDVDKMIRESKKLVGKHDFIAFMKTGSSVKTTVREVYDISIDRQGDMIIFEIEGKGFLYNMVRIIVGTLVEIGRGKITDDLKDIIMSKDRSKSGHTAPAHGLFLKKVYY